MKIGDMFVKDEDVNAMAARTSGDSPAYVLQAVGELRGLAENLTRRGSSLTAAQLRTVCDHAALSVINDNSMAGAFGVLVKRKGLALTLQALLATLDHTELKPEELAIVKTLTP